MGIGTNLLSKRSKIRSKLNWSKAGIRLFSRTLDLPLPVRGALAVIIGMLGVIGMLATIITPLELYQQFIFGFVAFGAGYLIHKADPSRRTNVALAILSVMISTRYIYWRVTETLIFENPIALLLGIGLFMAEIYAWTILVVGYVQTLWPLKRSIRPIQGEPSVWPTIDVYIPTYNEDLSIVQDTILAAMSMDYPPDRFRVWICDDGRRPEFEAYAREAGCGYITRQDNLNAKAGNLNNALQQTNGEIICVFDADHVPTRAFLQLTVGWFQADPKLALLQTPHFFYSPDPVQRNIPEVREMQGEGSLFYGVVQEGNDFWNAAFFCGSCALIRRVALKDTNGFTGETVTEDAHTSLKLQRKGWNTAYLNLRLSAGLATERLALHIGQRARWARGMTQIFRIDNPLFGPGLTPMQRICYLNAMLAFQFPLPRIVFLTSPLCYLLLGQNIINASPMMIVAYAGPHLAFATLGNMRVQGKYGRSLWSEVYEALIAFQMVKPSIFPLFNPKAGKFNVTDKGGLLTKTYFDWRSLRPQMITSVLLVLGIAVGFGRLIFDPGNVSSGTVVLNVFWSLYSLFMLLVVMVVGRERRQVRVHLRAKADLLANIYFEDGHIITGRIHDISMGGAAVKLDDPSLATGRMVSYLEISVAGRTYLLPAVSLQIISGRITMKFKELSLENRRCLVRIVFGRADAWPTAEDAPMITVPRALSDQWKAVRSLFSWVWADVISPKFRRKSAPDAPMNIQPATVSRSDNYRPSPVANTPFDKGPATQASLAFDSEPVSTPTTVIGTAKAPSPAAVIVALLLPAFLLPALLVTTAAALPLEPAFAQTRTATPQTRQQPRTQTSKTPEVVQTGITGGTRRVSISLKDLGVEFPLQLVSTLGEAGVNYNVRADEVVTEASLTMNFAYSPQLLSDLSQMVVLMNNEVVASIPLLRAAAGGTTLTIPINPALFTSRNRLNFRFIGHYTRECEDPLHSTLWSNISNGRTKLNVTLQRLNTGADLARLPAPFFDQSDPAKLRLPFVFVGQPSATMLKAAAATSSYFGMAASFRGFTFPVSFNDPPASEAVVFARSGALMGDVTLPLVDGPSVILINNPRNPFTQLLVISGRSDDEILQAARVLAASPSSLSGPRASVAPLTILPRTAYDGPRWLNTSKPARFGDLMALEQLEGQGLRPGLLTVPFSIPPDLFFWPAKGGIVEASYRYPNGPWLDYRMSRMDVLVNGKFLRSFPLLEQSAIDNVRDYVGRPAIQHDGKIDLPAYNVFGQNQLQFYFDLRVAKKGQCQSYLPENVRVGIDADSKIDLTSARHFAKLPDLAFFASSGFPFSRMGDQSETAVVLANQPSAAELEAFLTLVGRISDASGVPATAIEVYRPEQLTDEMVGRDILIIGALNMATRAPQLFEGAPIVVENGRLRVRSTDMLERILGRFGSNIGRSQSKLADQVAVTQGSLTSMVSWQSPYDDKRVVVALLSADPRRLAAIPASFSDPRVNYTIQGDLAIVGDGAYSSFRVGDGFWVGDLPLPLHGLWWASENPLVLVIIFILSSLIVATAVWFWLSGRARRRTRELGEE